MTLLRKRRRFRAGLPEYTGFVLLFATVALAVHWAVDQTRTAHMRQTTGRIVEVAGGEAAAPRVVFTYTVNGMLYSNVSRPDFTGRTLASLLPAAVMAKLTERGIVDFDDLPEEARRQIREGTDHTFDELNDADRVALQNHGYRNAEELRLSLLGAMDGTSTQTISGQSAAKRLTVNVSVPVLYDSDNPSDSTIARHEDHARKASLSGLMPLLIAAVSTCAYFGAAYPRLKGRIRAGAS